MGFVPRTIFISFANRENLRLRLTSENPAPSSVTEVELGDGKHGVAITAVLTAVAHNR